MEAVAVDGSNKNRMFTQETSVRVPWEKPNGNADLFTIYHTHLNDVRKSLFYAKP